MIIYSLASYGGNYRGSLAGSDSRMSVSWSKY